MHTYTLPNRIFDGPITNLLSILHMLIEIFSRAHAGRGEGGGRQTDRQTETDRQRQRQTEKSLNGFKFGTFSGRFPRDGAANMTVKGLNCNHLRAASV